ncbi:MAG: hypothetical protein HY782_08810 [Chloroflexi bacterium]|nr:hypothetical protein [Chloroflexota bacterium]
MRNHPTRTPQAWMGKSRARGTQPLEFDVDDRAIGFVVALPRLLGGLSIDARQFGVIAGE